jgi:hypothetical protein
MLVTNQLCWFCHDGAQISFSADLHNKSMLGPYKNEIFVNKLRIFKKMGKVNNITTSKKEN